MNDIKENTCSVRFVHHEFGMHQEAVRIL